MTHAPQTQTLRVYCAIMRVLVFLAKSLLMINDVEGDVVAIELGFVVEGSVINRQDHAGGSSHGGIGRMREIYLLIPCIVELQTPPGLLIDDLARTNKNEIANLKRSLVLHVNGELDAFA